jgi:hypothetical protein
MMYYCLQGRMGLLSHNSLQSNFLSDAIIESLPRGLSGKEREKVFQSVPLSPTLNLLSSMPQVSIPFSSACFRFHPSG